MDVEIPVKTQKEGQKNLKLDSRAGLSKNEMQRLQKRMLDVEEKISQLETNLLDLEKQLQNPPDDSLKVVQLGEKYTEMQSELTQNMKIWEELAFQLEQAVEIPEK